jgi:hypothetical protein
MGARQEKSNPIVSLGDSVPVYRRPTSVLFCYL